MSPLSLICGLGGSNVTVDERAFIRDADPLGFILFSRNLVDRDQIRSLCSELRDVAGREAPILVDQEGGTVQRLRPPLSEIWPPAARFGRLAEQDLARARREVGETCRAMARDLNRLGIDVNCAPVLDLRIPGSSPVIGERAFSGRPEIVADLGREACAGLAAEGVLPVIKHIPGHGRADVDSHVGLPRVTASRAVLEETDFAPFRLLADMPVAMTAHIVFDALDPDLPLTLSTSGIREVIRGPVGFHGLLLSDDLCMGALSGTLAERAEGAITAGCDVVLHCDGDMEGMVEVAGALAPMGEAARGRWEAARAWLRDSVHGETSNVPPSNG